MHRIGIGEVSVFSVVSSFFVVSLHPCTINKIRSDPPHCNRQHRQGVDGGQDVVDHHAQSAADVAVQPADQWVIDAGDFQFVLSLPFSRTSAETLQ